MAVDLEVERHPTYILVRVNGSGKDYGWIRGMDQWCKDRGIGKQVGMGRLSFKTEEDLAFFKLCWMGNDQTWRDVPNPFSRTEVVDYHYDL
jgi:hypothetical protein